MKSVLLGLIMFLLFCPFSLYSQNSDSLSAEPQHTGDPISGPDPAIHPENDTAVKPVEVEAAFPGGMVLFYDFVADHFEYPNRCLEEGISGKVRLRFVVDIRGNISNILTVDSTRSCPEFTAEAIRVLKMSPKWIPAQVNGKFVKSWREIPIVLQVDAH